jgi:hypothetical protein
MSTPVLVAIILLAMACAAVLTRLRLADRRSVAAHHRALETMGRLVAQHPPVEAVPVPAQPTGQAHVRLVAGTEPELPPVVAPRRSRPRILQPAEYRSWGDVAPVAPPPPPETTGPLPNGSVLSSTADAAVAAPPLLHFDALTPADTGTSLKLPSPHFRRSRRRSRIGLRRIAVGVFVVGLLAAGTVGGLLVSRDHPAPARSPHHPVARAAPPTTRATTPPTVPAAPVLVSSGAGYSEYRLSRPATILLTASGRCWVEIRQSGPSGPILYEGNLVAGDSKGAPASTWVRLGNPSNVTVRVNGVPISPPSLIAGEPYNLQFE